jgi:hypothetical protein
MPNRLQQQEGCITQVNDCKGRGTHEKLVLLVVSSRPAAAHVGNADRCALSTLLDSTTCSMAAGLLHFDSTRHMLTFASAVSDAHAAAATPDLRIPHTT